MAEFKKIFSGRALYTENDRIWVAKGMYFWAIDYNGNRISQKYSVGSVFQKVVAANRLPRQLLREGLHHLVVHPNGNFIITAKKKTYVVAKDGTIVNVFSGYRGNKPGSQGVCITPDGVIFFGEYTLNPNRDHGSTLYRSIDGGKTFQAILEFSQYEVRHIHFIKYDPYEKCVWMGTGDRDTECKLMRSNDNGDTWETIGEGSQDWRAIGVCFTPNFVMWGTDAGSVPDQNHIIVLDRKTGKTKSIYDAEGPCHGSATFKNGRIYISTGVEGGENEKDRLARLKNVDNSSVNELYSMKKDLFPFILQYGVFRFPLGTENTENVVFTAMGLRHGGEKVIVMEK